MGSQIEKNNRFWINCWATVLGIVVTVFFSCLIMFYQGNHDWQYMKFGMLPWHGITEARITQYLPPYFFLKGQIMPVFGVLFGLMFQVSGIVLLAKWYGMRQKYTTVVLFCLIFMLNPYILSSLYYSYLFLSFSVWHFLCILGVIFAFSFVETKKIKYFFACGGCLLSGLYGYVPCLALIVTCFCSKFLMSFLHKFNKKVWLTYVYSGLTINFFLVIYAISIKILKYYGVVGKWHHNTRVRNLNEIWEVFVNSWYEPFLVLIQNIPYVSVFSIICLTGLAFCAFERGVQNCHHKLRIMFILVFVMLFYMAFICVYISPHGVFYAHQVNVYSVPYLAAVWFVFSWGKNKLRRNISLFFAIGLICSYAKIDFLVQKIWLLGTKQDEYYAERIKAQMMPDIDFNKHYRMSIVGDFYGRRKFSGFEKISDVELDRFREYYGYGVYLSVLFSSVFFLYEKTNPIWADSMFLGNYVVYKPWNETILPKDKINAEIFAQKFGDDKAKLAEVAGSLCAYPCKNFYYIGQKDILLMVHDDELNRLILKWNIEHEGERIK